MARLTASALLVSVLLSACAMAPTTAPTGQDKTTAATRNGVLVGPNQMTLYVFDKDAPGSGKSVCNGGCATNWPPLLAKMGAQPIGDWSLVTRDDGSQQWAYKGRPLYFWAKDAKPGDMTGEGMLSNAWHVAKP